MRSFIRRPVAALVAACMLAVSLPAPVQAAETLSGVDRQRVEGLVVKALIHHGVEPAQARARAAALTDEEAARVAAEIDRLPAGGMRGDPISLIFALVVVAVGLVVLVLAIPVVIIKKIAEGRSGQNPAGENAGGTSTQYPEPVY